MLSFAVESLADAYQAAIAAALDGAPSTPRGMKTRESTNVAIQLLNPRRRSLTRTRRSWSLPLAIGELAWHLAASDDLSALAFYAPRWSEFATDGRIQGSNYGRRIFQPIDGVSQWDRCERLLTTDPQSRRALIQMFEENGDRVSTVDLSCAVSLQFMIRNDLLCATVHMRSNDAFLGFPYDVYLFTNLQELMAARLKVGLGSYTHYAASMHVYDRDIERARIIVADPVDISATDEPLQRPEEATLFVQGEKDIRSGARRVAEPSDPFWSSKLAAIERFRDTKRTGGPTPAVVPDRRSGGR